MLQYYPRHVSSINMPIFMRKNCIHTASGIFALCKHLHSTPVESGLENCALKLVDEIILYYDAQLKKHQILFYVFISICNSLHVSSTSCSSSGERNCINTASGNSHSVLVAEMCAGWKKTVTRGCIDTICLS